MAEVRVLDVTPQGWGKELIASYLVLGGEASALVDVGPRSSVDVLLAQLEEAGVRPKYIVVTHIHLDHAGAAGTLARRLGAKIVVHPRGAKHLVDPGKLWAAARQVLGQVAEVYGEPEPAPQDLVVEAGDGYRIPLGDGDELLVVHTPGHASHHMSILEPSSGILFTGDSAGVRVTVDGETVELPTTPPPLRLDLYLESIHKMKGLGARHCAPAHYGIVWDEDCGSFLEKQERMIQDWYQAVREAVSRGVRDIDALAEELAHRYPSAARAHRHPNPIVSSVFYRGTVWGLLEAALRELGG